MIEVDYELSAEITNALRERRRRRKSGNGGGAPAPDYAAEVESLLSGTTGFVIDPTDAATLFQDTAATVPVTTIGQSIFRANSKWGTTVFNFTNSIGGGTYPLWTGSGMDFDGANDFLGPNASAQAFFNAVDAVTVTVRAKRDSALMDQGIWGASTGTTTVTRLYIVVLNTGAILVDARRLDGDTILSLTTAAGLVPSGADFTVQVQLDYLTTGAVSIWLDGALVGSGTLNGSPGQTSATSTGRYRFGCSIAATRTNFFNGPIGRFVFARSLLDAGQRASCLGWVNEVTL